MSIRRIRDEDRNRSHRRHHRERPSEALLWARDLTGSCARVISIGSQRMLIENHTGIIELTDTRICLSTRCGPITVTGCGLSLCDVRQGALIVRGEIHRVDLPPEGGEPSR